MDEQFDDQVIDDRLRALMAAPAPAPDAAFVARVERAVAADIALRAARARAWRRFGREALATGALAAALGVLWWFGDQLPPQATQPATFGPAAAGLIALLLWQIVEQRTAMRR